MRQFRGQTPDDDDATVMTLGTYDPSGDEVLTAASGDVLYIQHFHGGTGGRSAQIRCDASAADSASGTLTRAAWGQVPLPRGQGPAAR